MSYARFKHATICWTRRWLWEIAVSQVVVGVGLLVAAYAFGTQEPPAVLWMSALALVFSGACTMAVIAATDSET